MLHVAVSCKKTKTKTNQRKAKSALYLSLSFVLLGDKAMKVSMVLCVQGSQPFSSKSYRDRF